MNWLAWSVLSAVFAAATALLAKLGVAGVHSNVATAIRTSVALVFACVVVSLTGRVSEVTTLSGRTWILLLLSGGATGLSWLCYFRALQIGPVSKVAPIDKLSLIFVVIGAAVFLGERISFSTGAGVLLVLAGVVILAVN